MSDWYFYTNEQVVGPIEKKELRALFARESLSLETKIWDGDPSQGGRGWLRAVETEIGISKKLQDAALYIIKFSDEKHFSRSKLEKYLIMLNTEYPIDITVAIEPRFRTPCIIQINECIDYLKEAKMIEEYRSSTGKKRGGGVRRLFRIKPGFDIPVVPETMKNILNQLIVQYDKKTASGMP